MSEVPLYQSYLELFRSVEREDQLLKLAEVPRRFVHLFSLPGLG